jgi:tRNA(fMet)-specific endonuclease VapC
MSVYLLDTDHFSLYQTGHPQVIQQLSRHTGDRLTISVITIEEQLAGWQRALRQARDDARRAEVYRRMALTVETLADWGVLAFTVAGMTRHAAFLRQRLNVGTNDLKIAATALEAGAIVVSRNQRDFGRIPGVVLEDWSV